MQVEKIQVDTPHIKPDGTWHVNTVDIKVPFSVKESWLISLPPGAMGGNHRHLRTEAFIGSGELEFIWLDERGIQHKEKFVENGISYMIVVRPDVPHAIRNTSDKTTALLYEMADTTEYKIEKVKVI